MKFYIILLMFFISAGCYANSSSLKNTAANYQQILAWSKNKIIQEAKADNSTKEIKSMLKGFPVTLKESCDSLKILFIQNKPQCGNINCKYLVFSEINSTYNYLSEIDFASERLICYPQKHNYLITSTHETNASSLFNLYVINENTILYKSHLEIDYTNKSQAAFADSLWDKNLDESSLLQGFKLH